MDSILCCPKCRGENLHQEQTQVFIRPTEDGPVQVITTSAWGDVLDSPDTDSENPSLRRDGLVIYFYCENCSHKPVLKIYQHKGTTYIEVE